MAEAVDVRRLRDDLAAAIGVERVEWGDDSLAEHAHDTWPLSLLRLYQGRLTTRPACVVRPASTDEVAAILRYANERRVPVVPYGGGSGVGGGVLPDGGTIVVDLRRLDQLLELNETALQVRVQAGMFGDRFEEALQARGYSMGHWPQSVALSTVGGWIATRAAGQYSTRYGSIEDMLLGLEAVMADGRVVRVKSTPRRSAGPDPRHLFLGAEGTAGIVTEATLKIFPLPDSRRLLSFAFPDFDSGLEAIRHIVRAGWRPPVVRLYDAMETGRHFGQWQQDDRCFLLLVSEGPASLAAAEAEACNAACTGHGGEPVGDAPVHHWLAERNNVPSLMSFIERGFVLDTIEVAVEWDRIHTLYAEVVAAMRTVKNLIVISGHSSHSYPQGTNIYFTFVAKPDDPAAAELTYLECWKQAMDATLRAGGTICHHHGIGRLRMPWMAAEHGSALDLMRAVKHALDPNGILNPGVLLP
ncbi:MAG TPA: FAD-binding oxidoreductase [Candidatus Dormibacteraeota bacterium]|nr:FAD-binding oxidoreductase [Candidatus Dormibacteraeota bacterium]